MQTYICNMYCTSEKYTINELYLYKEGIDENPPYQREGAVWSKEKKRLFIDTLINNYDIPKIYFDDLRPKKGLKKFAIVDGKQRLGAIWEFLYDGFELDPDGFKLNEGTEFENVTKGMKFSQFSPLDKERFQRTTIVITLLHDATEEDIEELFSRLNNGEPLNAAEERNAKGGDMNKLIKEIAGHAFFSKR